jgi:RHS repeat-associated protein
MKGYGPDGPPPLACVALFAIVSTTAGFRAAYDPNGNMVLRVEVSGTQRITYTQEYNAENRLAVVTNTVTGQVTRFGYDGDGNRVLRIGPEGTTVYIGDYYEKRGAVVTKYYYAAGQRMAMRVGGALYFLHGDHLGSATLTTDGGGNWVGEARYTPYGEMRRDYPRGVIPTDRLYTGQRQETFGLYDYRARYYHPALGRFISADPLVPEPGNPQALNRHAYVYNNPLGYIDPTGHFSEEELLRYGVFNGPRQMAAYQADEFNGADWYWALRAAEEGDWLETWWSFWQGFHSGGMVKVRASSVWLMGCCFWFWSLGLPTGSDSGACRAWRTRRFRLIPVGSRWKSRRGCSCAGWNHYGGM